MRNHRWLAGALLVALAVTGCSSGAGSESAAPAEDLASVGDGGYVESDDSGFDVNRMSGEIQTPQHVITEGYMTVVVDEPTQAAPEVTLIVTRAGGYVESRSERAPTATSAGRASLVLRIPATALDATLDEIEGLGELSSRDTSATDVSLAVADLDARIEALETSIDRLLAMLSDAQRTEDLITIERTLQERQGELESLRAQRTVLGNRVALATIELTLTTDPPPPTVGPGGFWPGVVSGWHALVDTLRGASVVVGILLPWAIFFGLLAALVVPLVRRARRRRPPKAPAPAPATYASAYPGPGGPYAQGGYAPHPGAAGAAHAQQAPYGQAPQGQAPYGRGPQGQAQQSQAPQGQAQQAPVEPEQTSGPQRPSAAPDARPADQAGATSHATDQPGTAPDGGKQASPGKRTAPGKEASPGKPDGEEPPAASGTKD